MKDEVRIAYDEFSPVTGNFCVIVEDDPMTGITSKLCMESGYITNDKLMLDTESQKSYDIQSTKLIQELKITDSAGSVWYPVSMTIGNIVFYIAGTTDSWQWVISRMIELDSADNDTYIIPGTDEYYKWHLDIENSLLFDSNKFSEAFDKFHELLRDDYAKSIQDSKESI